MPTMQGSGSRGLMANPGTADKCATHMQHCASGYVEPAACAHCALSAAAFLHSERNFLRSLPRSPLASACLEHSRDAVVRGFSAFFSAGAIFAGGAPGAVVCANAKLIKSRDAMAVAAAREDIVFMGGPRVNEDESSRCDAEPRVNESGAELFCDQDIFAQRLIAALSRALAALGWAPSRSQCPKETKDEPSSKNI